MRLEEIAYLVISITIVFIVGSYSPMLLAFICGITFAYAVFSFL